MSETGKSNRIGSTLCSELWTERACPLCGEVSADILAELSAHAFCDVNFAYRQECVDQLALPEGALFPIVRCCGCGFVYSRYLLLPATLSLVYEEVIAPEVCYQHSTSLKVVKHHVALWQLLLSGLSARLDTLGPVKVLDIGAGWGTFLEVARAPGISVYAYETSKRRIDHMRNRNITVLTDLSEVEKCGPYHVICCDQVLEHVPDPEGMMTVVGRILHDDGIGYLAVPNYGEDVLARQIALFKEGKAIPKELNPWEHLNYFSPDSLRTMLRRHVEVIDMQRENATSTIGLTTLRRRMRDLSGKSAVTRLLARLAGDAQVEGTALLFRKKK